MSRFFLALTLAALSAAAQAPATSKTYESVDAVLWTQTSVEYQASTRQVYVAARAALDRALATPHWVAALEANYIGAQPQPPAVILDLDETVLDNSPYRAPLAKAGQRFTEETWEKWVMESRAGLVPGAREFLRYARMRGVMVTTSPTGNAAGMHPIPRARTFRRGEFPGCRFAAPTHPTNLPAAAR